MGDTDYVRDEIRALKQAVGNKVLKVIIETCLLTEAEKRKSPASAGTERKGSMKNHTI